MKNQSGTNKIPSEKKSPKKEEKNIKSPKKVTKTEENKTKSQEKMKIKIDENLAQELAQTGQEKKPKVKIFNNKKNNGICSELLRATFNTEKELMLVPYAKEKQRVNKTLNTIGSAHGISYPKYSVIKGIPKDKNYLYIIRNDDKRKNKGKKNNLMNNRIQNKAEINLDNLMENNNLKEMLGNADNIHNYI